MSDVGLRLMIARSARQMALIHLGDVACHWSVGSVTDAVLHEAAADYRKSQDAVAEHLVALSRETADE